MTDNTLFHLLTEEYTLLLAQNSNDFKHVMEIRKKIFSPKYNLSPKTLESQGYLFNQDDEQSFIYLLKHNPSNTYVGTIRIYFINNNTPVQKLSIEKDAHITGISYSLDIAPICEVSRLGLLNNLPPHNELSPRQLSTYLAFLLMVAARNNYFLYHCSTVYTMMEPSLNIILRRQGVKFKKIGNPINYYGMRIPYSNTGKKLMLDTEKKMHRLTHYYLKELCNNSEKFWQFIDNNPYLERKDIHLDKICKLFEAYGDDVPLELLMDNI